MYEWLDKELAAIKTRQFHVVDGPDPLMKEAVDASALALPDSYREFVVRFGNAKLYRSRSYHLIQVYAGPREVVLRDGTMAYLIGHNDGANAYICPKLEEGRFPVYEQEAGPMELDAEDFSEWLTDSAARARRSFGKEKWAEILKGPAPFTPEELEIIEARRRILWKVIGIDADGTHVFQVNNTSDRTLQMLGVGVHTKDRRLNGRVGLQIRHIGPGQSGEVRANCYKDLVDPHEIEVFSLPDPEPEDRDDYWELRGL